jgi:deoxyribodipyrimidine photo-lyase
MPALLWFKRDLRVADHPALAAAAALGPVLPVYLAEPDYWRLPDTSARQWEFTAEGLADLRRDLATLGLTLVIRVGDAVGQLAALAARHRITHLVSHEETGNLWTYARDVRVAAWAREAGLAWLELPQSGVTRRLADRDRWTALRDRYMSQPLARPQGLSGLADPDPGPIPTARDLGLSPDPCPGRQQGGRTRGLQTLDTFLAERGRDYRRAMSSPLQGARACSRLSPHLALGTLSLREVVQRVDRQAPRDPVWSGSLSSLQSRLAWRDHFMQKLEDEPAIETRCLDPRTDDLRPRSPDAARLAAWARGETGFPFLDACIRSLIATGWLNFRMRAMVMSVASYTLWLDWRATGPVLARWFTDYEPGIHWPQVQMQSGTTGINTPRIYNPVKQGADQDPTGAFTRAWCPELGPVPDAHLQTPWTWQGARTLRYPAPVVDLATANRAARAAIWALRRAPDHAATVAPIVAKHASRKDRRFVRDPAPLPQRQLKLEL